MGNTWTRTSLFDPADLARARKITLKERAKLLFKRSQYAVEEGVVLRYKRMNGKIYVLQEWYYPEKGDNNV